MHNNEQIRQIQLLRNLISSIAAEDLDDLLAYNNGQPAEVIFDLIVDLCSVLNTMQRLWLIVELPNQILPP